MENQDLKKMLLNFGEDFLKQAIHSFVRPELEKFIKNSSNKYDDMLLPFLDQLEKAAVDLADKIDGEVG
jgi:hypothetical protein